MLRRWREAISRDPELTSSSGLSGGVLEDHFPNILEAFERRLRSEHALQAMRVELQQRKDAAEHGGYRWQQGYHIRETIREWGHLQSVLLQELEHYAADHPDLERETMATAREVLTKLCMEGNCESASRYVQLQQLGATSRLRDLESSLRSLESIENERAALLRETAHDLRGSFAVIANTTAILARPQVTGPQRDRFYNLLRRRMRSTAALLTDLVELSRLEAGQDPLKIEPFDAVRQVREFCEALRPVAEARNLFLKYEGLVSLPVEGDLLKLQRIVQNLLVNAVQATHRGGVVVRCSAEGEGDARRWTLSIEDTGPGITQQAAGHPAHAPEDAGEDGSGRGPPAAGGDEIKERRRATPKGLGPLPSGEGIGLSIVRRLCDLLGATVECETASGHGTKFRITFPAHYRRTVGDPNRC